MYHEIAIICGNCLEILTKLINVIKGKDRLKFVEVNDQFQEFNLLAQV